MKVRTRVIICGKSLHMAGLAASLKAEAGLEVVPIHPDSFTARQHLNELHPKVIVFDLLDPALDLDIALLRERPGLLLIGVDPSSGELLLLSSRCTRALSVADLLRVIPHEDWNTKPDGEATSENNGQPQL